MRIGKESHGQTSAIFPEFRQRAVRMVAESPPGSNKRIAGQLGISYETLRKWVRQAEIDGGLKPGTTTEQLEEMRRLRKENAELRRAKVTRPPGAR